MMPVALAMTPKTDKETEAPVTAAAFAETLRVVVRGLRLAKQGNGVLRAALFLNERGFPDDPHQAAFLASLELDEWVERNTPGNSSARQDGAEVELELSALGGLLRQAATAATKEGLPDAERVRVAIAVFHDANSNGRLDKGLLGIPREGFGFSANPQIWRGAPKFDDCLVIVGADRPSIVIDMKYLLGPTSRATRM